MAAVQPCTTLAGSAAAAREDLAWEGQTYELARPWSMRGWLAEGWQAFLTPGRKVTGRTGQLSIRKADRNRPLGAVGAAPSELPSERLHH